MFTESCSENLKNYNKENIMKLRHISSLQSTCNIKLILWCMVCYFHSEILNYKMMTTAKYNIKS